MYFEKFQPRNKHRLVFALTISILAIPKAQNLASWSLEIFFENELKNLCWPLKG